jgi:hypothetical protein
MKTLSRQNRLEGDKIRAIVEWLDKGEKPTRFFCHLENQISTKQ